MAVIVHACFDHNIKQIRSFKCSIILICTKVAIFYMAAILKTIQSGGSKHWFNYHENDSCISLNDSNNIDISETEKKAFWKKN